MLLTESNDFGIKTPDYKWREKLWELKTISTTKATDDAVRRGIKQIRKNPGGIILDFGNNEFDLNEVVHLTQDRFSRSAIKLSDIIIISKESTEIIMRYKK